MVRAPPSPQDGKPEKVHVVKMMESLVVCPSSIQQWKNKSLVWFLFVLCFHFLYHMKGNVLSAGKTTSETSLLYKYDSLFSIVSLALNEWMILYRSKIMLWPYSV